MQALRNYLMQYLDESKWERYCGYSVVAREALDLLNKAEYENQFQKDAIARFKIDRAIKKYLVISLEDSK